MKRAISITIIPALFIGLLATCKEDKQPNAKKSSEKQITSFIFQKEDNASLNSDAGGTIDQEAYTVSVIIPDSVFQSQDTTLAPTITLSSKASVNPPSGVEQNFSDPVIYTVKAEDGSEQAYTVTVMFQQTPKKSSEKQITSFIFQEEDNAGLNSDVGGTIDQETYTVSVIIPDSVFQSQDTTLAPTITLSSKASVTPLSGVERNFSDPVIYTVKAEDGSEQAYTVTVTFQQTSELSGSFVGTSSHPTSGEARATPTSLSLKNFQTDSGPKLNVYLSLVSDGEDVANDYVDLGPLPKALQDSQGDHTFAIPENTDLSKYKYVVIWCVDFDVAFGYALLQ